MSREILAKAAAIDPKFAAKLQVMQQGNQLASDHAGVERFLKQREQQRMDDYTRERMASKGDVPIPMANPNQIPDVPYQAPSPIEQWRERINAMVASGNPTIQKQAYSQINDLQKEAIKPPETPDSWSTTDANTYRDDYRTDTKDYNTQITSFKTMLSAASPDKNGNFSAAGDKALIYRFAKMLDPTGIVTETDFDNARSSGGLPTQIQGYLKSMENGLLPNSVRNDILNIAGDLYNQAIDGIAEKRSFYAEAASGAGVPLNQVFKSGKIGDKYERRYIDPSANPEKITTIKDVGSQAIDAISDAIGLSPSKPSTSDIYGENLKALKGIRKQPQKVEKYIDEAGQEWDVYDDGEDYQWLE